MRKSIPVFGLLVAVSFFACGPSQSSGMPTEVDPPTRVDEREGGLPVRPDASPDAQPLGADASAPQLPPALFLLGSAGADYTKAAATTRDGDIGMVLVASGPVGLDSEGVTLPSTDGGDLAFVVYDASTGRAKRWLRSGGPGLQVPHGLAFDNSGNASIIGYTRPNGVSTANFDPAKSPANDIAYSGGEKPFVAQYTPSGALAWSRVFDHPSAAAMSDRAWDLAVDEVGDVYVVGTFRGSLALDATHVLVSNADSVDIFVAKLSARDGSIAWGFAIGGPEGDGGPEGSPVAPGGTGDVALAVAGDTLVVQGEMRSTVSFAGTGQVTPSSTRSSAGGTDLFVARFAKSTGAFASVTQLGGPGDETSVAGAMRTDEIGNTYIAGRFSGSIAIGASQLTHAGTGSSMFLAALGSDLAPRWARALASDGGLDGIHRLAFDSRGGLFAAGWHGGETNFGTAASPNVVRSNTTGPVASDIFVARFEATNGNLTWVAQVPGKATHNQNQIAAALTVDRFGDAWIGGQIFTATSFDGEGGRTLTPVGLNDAFVARYAGSSGKLR
jgi:hypothetical protein